MLRKKNNPKSTAIASDSSKDNKLIKEVEKTGIKCVPEAIPIANLMKKEPLLIDLTIDDDVSFIKEEVTAVQIKYSFRNIYDFCCI